MQELQAGSSHRFLLKALGEASGELRNLLYTGAFGGELREGEGVDAGWCLLAVAVHMRDVEHGVARQIETILRRPGSDLRHVDFDDIPLREDYEDADIEDAVADFHYARRETSYLLWSIGAEEWELAGLHPYRGKLPIIEIARELYQHDLEHLWQATRLLGRSTRSAS